MSLPLIPITRKQALLFATFLVLYEFLTYIANDMIMPGMLQVVKTFHGVETDIAASLSLYILGGSVLQVFLGPLSDRFGRRPVMIAGALVFLLFTVAIACSSTMRQFLWGRFFQGMGLCFISVVGYATLQEIFDEMDAVRLTAMMANVSILAPLLGPLCGAISAHYFNWRIIFVLIGLFSVLALWGLWRYIPESVGQTKRDGTVIPRSKLSPKVIGSNFKDLLRNPVFMCASIAFGLAGLPCVAWIGLSPVIIVNVGHYSLIEYGLWQMPVFAAIIVGNVVLRKLTHSYSIEQLIWMGAGGIVFGLFLTLIGAYWNPNDFLFLMPGLMVYFFGLGILGSPMSRFILFATPVAKGTAAALESMIIMTVQAMGVEGANRIYMDHSNVAFSWFCLLQSILCIGLILFSVRRKKENV